MFLRAALLSLAAATPALAGAPVLHAFRGVPHDGARPEAELVAAPDGSLYGTTVYGGAHNAGSVFRLEPPESAGAAWEAHLLYSFRGGRHDPRLPRGRLLADGMGGFYGTSEFGGAADGGTVWHLSPPPGGGEGLKRQWQLRILHDFASTEGAAPGGGLIRDDAGALYGTLASGVFRLAPPDAGSTNWQESTLFSFASGPGGGGHPAGDLLLGQDGDLYGVTKDGGAFNGGSVFRLRPPVAGQGWTAQVLWSFGRFGDGFEPAAGLTRGPDGRLYGTTVEGGRNLAGTIYALAPSRAGGDWNEAIVAEPPTGAYPYGRVAFDPSGRAYATTYQGGRYGLGTVFRATEAPDGWTTEDLLQFGGTNGSGPTAGLTLVPGGFVGTATAGGRRPAQAGVAYALTP
jgi:uncharacterized repeat protein (TIGR03803 family)